MVISLSSTRVINQLKAYSSSLAIELRHQVETGEKGALDKQRVYLDAARPIQSGRKDFDWNNRITLLLSLEEMMKVASALLGISKRCEFQGRKSNSSVGPIYKNLTIERQEDHVYLRVGTKALDNNQNNNKLMSMPVSDEMSGAMGMLLLNAIAMSIPGNTTDTVLTTLRLLASHRPKQ